MLRKEEIGGRMSKVYSWGKCKKCWFHGNCRVENAIREVRNLGAGAWANYGLGCSMWEGK